MRVAARKPISAQGDEREACGNARFSQTAVLWIGVILLVYLCWLLVAPFIAAIAWAFALTLLVDPFERQLRTKIPGKNLRSSICVVVACLVIVVPSIFLVAVLVREVAQGAATIASASSLNHLRGSIEHGTALGSALRWVDSRIDLPKELAQAARGMMNWAYNLTSSVVTGSAWMISQLLTMVVLLFYFLRDGPSMVAKLRSVLPWSEGQVDRVFSRIADTIRVSLYGKLVVAAVQGALGGLIFWWLALPAPAFWGFVMALLSVLPVLGAFVIWFPAAIALAIQGLWLKAIILTGWGVLIVHPVDNLLGPVLVGTKLRLHTIMMFFSVLGGIAAFGASGIVLGPVVVAIAVALFEVRQQELATRLET